MRSDEQSGVRKAAKFEARERDATPTESRLSRSERVALDLDRPVCPLNADSPRLHNVAGGWGLITDLVNIVPSRLARADCSGDRLDGFNDDGLASAAGDPVHAALVKRKVQPSPLRNDCLGWGVHHLMNRIELEAIGASTG